MLNLTKVIFKLVIDLMQIHSLIPIAALLYLMHNNKILIIEDYRYDFQS